MEPGVDGIAVLSFFVFVLFFSFFPSRFPLILILKISMCGI